MPRLPSEASVVSVTGLKFVGRVIGGFCDSRGLLLAGAIACYTLLSVLPLLILLVLALSRFLPEEELLVALGRYLDLVAPGHAEPLVEELAKFLAHREVTGVALLATLLVASALAFRVLERASAAIFHHREGVHTRRWYATAIIPYVYILLLGTGLLLVTLASGALEALGTREVEVQAEQAAQVVGAVEAAGDDAVVEALDTGGHVEVDFGLLEVVGQRQPQAAARSVQHHRVEIDPPFPQLQQEGAIGQPVGTGQHLVGVDLDGGVESPQEACAQQPVDAAGGARCRAAQACVLTGRQERVGEALRHREVVELDARCGDPQQRAQGQRLPRLRVVRRLRFGPRQRSQVERSDAESAAKPRAGNRVRPPQSARALGLAQHAVQRIDGDCIGAGQNAAGQRRAAGLRPAGTQHASNPCRVVGPGVEVESCFALARIESDDSARDRSTIARRPRSAGDGIVGKPSAQRAQEPDGPPRGRMPERAARR